MLLEKIFGGILVALVLGFGSWIYHAGWFRNATYEVKTLPSMYVVYKEHVGPYEELTAIRREASRFLKARGIPCLGTYDQLLTVREVAKPSELKANSGCIVPGEVKDLGTSGWSYKKMLPQENVLVVTFEGSWLGAQKKLGEVRAKYLKLNNKRPTSFTRIHYPAFPLWGQPVQIGVYGLADANSKENDKTVLPPTRR